jgi:hypothetical protein
MFGLIPVLVWGVFVGFLVDNREKISIMDFANQSSKIKKKRRKRCFG